MKKNLVQMNKVTDPTPAPFPSCARPFPLTRLPVAFPVAFPLEGRGVKYSDPTPAPPLQGRGVPHGVPAAGKAVATPLPCRGGAGVGSVY